MLVTSNSANKGVVWQLGQEFTWKSEQEGCWSPASSAREQWHPPQRKPWPLWALHAPWMTQLPRDSSRGNVLALRCQMQGVFKGSGAQAMPSSILHLAGNDERRNRKRQQINTWLSAWCSWQKLGSFFDFGSVYRPPGLLDEMGYTCLKSGLKWQCSAWGPMCSSLISQC